MGPALEQALACHRVPALLSVAVARPLPEDMLVLIRLAAGDDGLAAECAASSGESAAVVVEAAVFFVQQVMFSQGSDSYRILGVGPAAPDAQVKEHYRWLVRWLHPDRNADPWEAIFTDRVNRAWKNLRTPIRRQAYDASLAAPATASASSGGVTRGPAAGGFAPPPQVAAELGEPLFSPSTVQRLPMIVLGGMGAVATLALVLIWYSQASEGGQGYDGQPVAGSSGNTGVVENARLAEPSPAAVSPPPAVDARASLPGARTAEVVAPASMRASVVETAGAPLATSERVASTPPPPPRDLASGREGRATAAESTSQPATAPAADRRASRQAALQDAGAADQRLRTVAPAPAPASKPERVAAVPQSPPAPAPEVASTAAPAPEQQVADEAAALELLGNFRDAYRSGDINQLMRLFTSDATNNRGGRNAIAYDYQSLFSSTGSRELRLTPTVWFQRPEGAAMVVRFEARTLPKGKRRFVVSRGDIRFDLRQESGVLRISKMRHEQDGY